jgi:hypothetical protein
VSLGAYEAGALTETLRLLEFNNAQPGCTKWYIDALTGASAGSITAALVALALINSGSNYLKTVWMEAISLAALSPSENSHNPSDGYYLLAASKLDELAARYVQFPVSVSRHPALRSGDAELKAPLHLIPRQSFAVHRLEAGRNRFEHRTICPDGFVLCQHQSK